MHRRSAKKTITLGGLALFLTLAGAQAGTQYDVKIERAAMEQIARRIGDIRPGLAFDANALLPAPTSRPVASPEAKAAAQRANEFWLPKGRANAASTKNSGSFHIIGQGDGAPTSESRSVRKGAIPKVLKF